MALLLHPRITNSIHSLVEAPPHALLLIGPLGAGKYSLAIELLSSITDTSKLLQSAYFKHLTPINNSTGIDQIRELQAFVQLKTTGTGALRRAILVEDADTMTTEAQNALLKVLEEPPTDTIIVLTASQPQNLKPTIHSRVQTLNLLPVDKATAIEYFAAKNYVPADIEKAYSISNGQPGLLTALLDTTDEHVLKDKIILAKQLYGMTAFERLTKVDELAKQKEELPSLFYACKRICSSALEQAALKQQDAAISTWHRQLGLISQAESSLPRNPNTKLLLTDLFVSM